MIHIHRKALTTILAFVCAVIFLGCGPGIAKHKVTGNVDIDGQPLTEGQLTFQPIDTKVPPEGTAIKGGKYSVDIAAGSYKVRVIATKKVPLAPGESTGTPGEKEKLVSIIPEHYHDQNSLTAEVKGPGEINFNMTSKKK